MGPNPPTILELRSSLVPPQPNRILTHKPTRIRLIISEEVVMQSGLEIGILVLQAEGLVSILVNRPFFFRRPQPVRYSCQTTRGCRPYQSFLLGCRFSHSESRGDTFFVFVDVVSIGETAYVRLHRSWKYHQSYNQLMACDYQLVIGLCKFAQNFNNDCSKNRNSDRSLSTTRPNSLKRYLDFVLSITSY